MKSEDYQQILQHNVGPSVRKLGLPQRSWVFQQDNDPKHTSKSTRKWFERKSLETFKVASNESRPESHRTPVVRDLKMAVWRRHPSNIRDLEQFAKEEWSKIPAEHCKTLNDGYRKRCIVKITGDMTVSFPSGIIKVFTSNPSPAVLCFRLKNTSKLEQILPNTQLLYSDPSQSDNNCKDFWMNMQAVTAYLKKSSEQNPSASYYNVDILKYQVVEQVAKMEGVMANIVKIYVDFTLEVSSNGIQSTPLNLATYWKCNADTTDVRLDYKYNPESMAVPSALSNIQVMVPVDGAVTNMQSIPTAVWNAEQMKAFWKMSVISEKSENGGSGSLRAKFDVSEGPSNPSTLAVQFISDGGTLSGVDIELVGTGYRLSLVKRRFGTGKYMADY
ncbi:unnamed protein product [Ranitomeya imitator]|uniref:MHD domain-containing protein n=1 Tax=Ranitomeya imitator TaxID=111125 RepID=A0ABN9LF59_9NEOB|nr:unnamed protein product [Ranitomeya imitator]